MGKSKKRVKQRLFDEYRLFVALSDEVSHVIYRAFETAVRAQENGNRHFALASYNFACDCLAVNEVIEEYKPEPILPQEPL